ncbi:hypothetical protein LEP3755_63000 (plasmid) [Leptolyngbya sp. NIES-3755]|nr:hypothetical protein LEP3755_63000 [Leptolyngbya sp. NIES-3755]
MFSSNLSPKKSQSKKTVIIESPKITAEEFYHTWSEVWDSETFDLDQFALYTNEFQADALRLLQQMEYAGYLILGYSQPDQVQVMQHLFKRDGSGFVLTRFNSLTDLDQQLDSENAETLDQIAACKRLWTSMRIWSSFSANKLQLCSHTSDAMTREYVDWLYRLGYLRLTQTQTIDCPNRENVYQLINRNPKWIPPLLSDTGRIYDFNRDEIYIHIR